MLMMSGVYEEDSNVTQLGNFKLENYSLLRKKVKTQTDKSGLKSGGHIRPGPDLTGFDPGRIPAGARAGYDIRCNPREYIRE